jgi:poly(3-hydroxybutyrate) depolymerase
VLVLACACIVAAQAQSGRNFDAEWARLKRGRQYGAAKTGSITYQFAALDGASFETLIEVPETYDPARKWPVRVQLHGGVNRPLNRERPRRPNALAGALPQIYVYPRAWAEAQWWQGSQVDNILNVLEKLKREYNVDESRIYVTGFSDGGTGAFFFGMRAPTSFSAIMPLHGNIGVLANPTVGTDGQMYPGNLANRPIFATNGGHDPLYPVNAMAPLIAMIERTGVELVYRALGDAGHETSWWPNERDRYERFVMEHPRRPERERLSWETERSDRYNRVDWLVITALGATPSDQPLEDVAAKLFPRVRASGRVDVMRKDNAFEARTRGVKAFTLLLSPDVIDFVRPISVTVNGRVAFAGTLAKDPAVLLKWAARDNDRDVLYAAELKVQVK